MLDTIRVFFKGVVSVISLSVNMLSFGTLRIFAAFTKAISVFNSLLIESARKFVQAHGTILLFSGVGSTPFKTPTWGDFPRIDVLIYSKTGLFF